MKVKVGIGQCAQCKAQGIEVAAIGADTKDGGRQHICRDCYEGGAGVEA